MLWIRIDLALGIRIGNADPDLHLEASILSSLQCSEYGGSFLASRNVVDPNPVGSETFSRIRRRIRKIIAAPGCSGFEINLK